MSYSAPPLDMPADAGKRANIRIDSDGSILCLYDDSLRLQQIGTLNVDRASTIEFDEALQAWHVRDASSGQALYSHPSRSACIAWEQAHFNGQLSLP